MHMCLNESLYCEGHVSRIGKLPYIYPDYIYTICNRQSNFTYLISRMVFKTHLSSFLKALQLSFIPGLADGSYLLTVIIASCFSFKCTFHEPQTTLSEMKI